MDDLVLVTSITDGMRQQVKRNTACAWVKWTSAEPEEMCSTLDRYKWIDKALCNKLPKDLCHPPITQLNLTAPPLALSSATFSS